LGKLCEFILSRAIFVAEDIEQRPDPGTGRPKGRDMGWQDKIAASGAGTDGTRIQYGALCWRDADHGIEVLLITSRDTGRWVIPKGWPIRGLAPEAAAAQEAWEEAGVEGEVSPMCLGRYGYSKSLSVSASVPCAVAVYGLCVAEIGKRFPEAKERQRQWFPKAEAAALVAEPELAVIITGFAPPAQGRRAPISAEDEAARDQLDRLPGAKSKDGRRPH
jgi:8-oxo-dGTP pyrophosphatase MutT (NUDIX family)